MRALVWHGRGDVRVEDVAPPAKPGPGEVVVDIAWCGICGTDVEEYTDGPIVIPATPHPLTGLSAPMIIGHEAVGYVSSCGPGVDFEPGTLVALDGYLYCGECYACSRHEVNRCDRWAHLGMSFPGGLAEQVLVPASMAIPATRDIAAVEFALAEPFSVAVRAVRRSGLSLGHRVVIVGGGTIGLAILQVARTSGAGRVVLVDPYSSRRDLARVFGADEVASDLEDLRDEEGSFDLVFECTGSSDVAATTVSLPRPGGTVVLVGLPPHPSKLDFKTVVLRELTLVGTVGHVYDEDVRSAVELLCSGRVQAGPMISHRLPLERAVADGIQFLAGDGRSSALKILVGPNVAGTPADARSGLAL